MVLTGKNEESTEWLLSDAAMLPWTPEDGSDRTNRESREKTTDEEGGTGWIMG